MKKCKNTPDRVHVVWTIVNRRLIFGSCEACGEVFVYPQQSMKTWFFGNILSLVTKLANLQSSALEMGVSPFKKEVLVQ